MAARVVVVDRHEANQGMNWIRKEKRLAIYLRDGMACGYCGVSVEDGARLTLDHLKPHSKGGDNEASNLLTVCHPCNSSRGNRAVATFARAVAEYLDHGTTAAQIMKHIRACSARKLDVNAAKELMSRRGSWTACLEAR